ncbi:MAG: ATP-grasp domain-containing protein [Pirellulaceae bacterium]
MQMQPPNPPGQLESQFAVTPSDVDRLLVIGASCRALAQAAVREGLKVDAIDLFCDTDLKTVAQTVRRIETFPNDIPRLTAAMDRQYWMYSGGLENHPGAIDEVCRSHPLLGISGENLRSVRSPESLAQQVKIPDTRVSFPLGEGTWLLKPRHSGGGLGIHLANSEPFSSESHYAQRQIQGTTGSSLFLGDGKSESLLLSSFYAITCPNDPWRYFGSIGPISLPAVTGQRCADVGRPLVRAYALTGLFGVDWILDDDGQLWVLEINPRWTATAEICHRVHEWPLVRWHINACLNGELPCERPATSNHMMAKRILYTRQEIVFEAQMLKEWEDAVSVESIQWCDIPHAGTTIQSDQPVCTFLLLSDNHDPQSLHAFTETQVEKLQQCNSFLH